jgi:hypothetical protein
MPNKKISTNWYKFNKLLVTEISGKVNLEDVIVWEKSLYKTLEKIEDNTGFKVLVNLHGFQPESIEVHKRFRTIIPAAMADYGWKVGYVNLFEEAANMKIRSTRGIHCFAAAHVHEDSGKIEHYEYLFGKNNEHFFTDYEKALDWIRKYNSSHDDGNRLN